jgi:hypothetical protein
MRPVWRRRPTKFYKLAGNVWIYKDDRAAELQNGFNEINYLA